MTKTLRIARELLELATVAAFVIGASYWFALLAEVPQ